jgi:hypothetical protein
MVQSAERIERRLAERRSETAGWVPSAIEYLGWLGGWVYWLGRKEGLGGWAAIF